MSRSIFGWDLPPGCRVSDIPGNRPEDEAWEAIYDGFWDKERLTNTHVGTRVSEEAYNKMDKIWKSNSKVNQALVELIDNYIMAAIEYGIELGEKAGISTAEENKYYEQQFLEQLLRKEGISQEVIDKIAEKFYKKEL